MIEGVLQLNFRDTPNTEWINRKNEKQMCNTMRRTEILGQQTKTRSTVKMLFSHTHPFSVPFCFFLLCVCWSPASSFLLLPETPSNSDHISEAAELSWRKREDNQNECDKTRNIKISKCFNRLNTHKHTRCASAQCIKCHVQHDVKCE